MTQSSRQIVTFHPRHAGAMKDGSKRSTVRWNESIELGTATFVFDPPDYPPLIGEVLSIAEHLAGSLTAEDAHAEPDTDMARFVEELRVNYYPTMPDDAVLQIVTFTVDSGAQPTK